MLCLVSQAGVLVPVDPPPPDVSQCTGYVIQSSAEFQSVAFDSAQCAQYFFFGFGIVVGSYLAGFAVGAVRDVVRRAT